MEKIDNYLTLLKDEIRNNSFGHLALKYRVQLMRYIDSPLIVNKIFYNCVVKIKSLKEGIFQDNEILLQILFEIRDYLYNNKGDKNHFMIIFDKYKNYLYEYDALGGLLLSLCFNIATDASLMLDIAEYNEEDDNEYDFEMWNPDFFAEIICSEGVYFIPSNSGSVEKREAYWIWVLDIIGKICRDANFEVAPLYYQKGMDEKFTIPSRNQLDDTIEAQFKDILFYIVDCEPQKLKEGLEYKILFVSSVVDMFSILSSKGDAIILSTKNVDKICNAFRNIREQMYKKNSKQGAWFQVEILLKNKDLYTLNFNYDNFEQIPSLFQEPDWLLKMFKEYPRSKEYTPSWLQKIVGSKVKYLKS